MNLLNKPEQIWILKPSKKDLLAGARYASLSLPWTFNRMMLNTKSPGQQFRALNIAKGIVGQEMLRRALQKRNRSPKIQQKSHRDEDLFDFKLKINGKIINLDFKTIHVFTDYPGVDREPFSPQLIIKNSGYPGPDWRRFLPMLVPHTQIKQDKDAYCFAIATSIDPRKDIKTNRDGHALTAFPYGEHLAFLGSKRLCIAREEATRGFYISCYYENPSLFYRQSDFTVNVIGEWDEKICEEEVALKHGVTRKNIGPFSCVSSFQINYEDFQKFDGKIEISINANKLKEPIYNSARRNINSAPSSSLVLTPKDFCNLILPNDYILYVLGWTTKKKFLENCSKYPSWVWPLDRENKYKNQAWSQITEKDKLMLTRVGFDNYIQKKPSRIMAGFMKTHGRGGGACCYVFPNIGRGGGIKETNLYVLPQDLYIMNDLGK